MLLRTLGALWCSPNTLAGLLLALPFARFGDVQGEALRFRARPGGPLAFFFRRARVSAFTWGQVVVYRDDERLWNDAGLFAHERRHVIQQLLLGPLMLPAYVGCSAWALLRGGHAYRDNWLERDARRAATRRAASTGSAPGARAPRNRAP